MRRQRPRKLKPGTHFAVEHTADGILLRPLNPFPQTRIEDVCGMLKYDGPARTLEEMDAVIANRQTELAALCRRLGVRRLEIFGSAAVPGKAATARDLDFLVDLGDLPPVQYAETYFSLREALESLFGRPVDLLTEPSLQNPYFRQSVERSKALLYAA